MDEVRLTWDGLIDGASAPNGAYSWQVTLTPTNGIGFPGYANGSLKVVRKANPHDYTDNGSPDLLARDTAGVLWTYLSKGDGTFGTRTKVGPGWGIYNKLAAGSDLTGDGRDDLVATDASGLLWLYKGAGSAMAPYAARVKVGSGWGVYNQLTAVGNIAGGVAGDLLARDTAGVLWLYLGKGDGTFAARTRIGTGWGGYSQLVGVGDADNDGRSDLVAYGSAGTHVFLGTGAWATPFTKTATSLYAGEGTKFTSVS
ncbi:MULTISPECIES: FG-GAP repeat domain-containing protein [Streptomyces]|uniref:FG-GAP repeat domain-containing protein n=1 Tax=Streptomyces TaxID=1883 RepID=UPI001CC23095|nr:VCBS repeat-containing protein [Streptomyces venezuelae]